MLRKKMLFASLFLCSALVLPAAAKGAAKDKPATSTLLNQDAAYNFYRIRSDGNGDYKNLTNVVSIVQPNGDWILDMTGSNAARSVFIDFGDYVSGTGPNGSIPIPPFTSNIVKARIIADCARGGYEQNMLTMSTSTWQHCPLVVRFDDNVGNSYRILMHNIPPPSSDGYSDTDPATVTCTGAIGSQCNSWTIEPSATYTNVNTNLPEKKNVGKLVKIATKPHQSDQVVGNFYFSFDIRVTTP